MRDSWNPVFNRIGLSGSVDPATDQSVWVGSTGWFVGRLQGDDNDDGVHGSTGGFLAGAQTRRDGWTYGVTGSSTQFQLPLTSPTTA